MKKKKDFVTNSSSSSFVISIRDLTETQQFAIMNYHDFCNSMGWSEFDIGGDDHWSIDARGSLLRGSTFMDNFDMMGFLEKIGVDPNKVRWE